MTFGTSILENLGDHIFPGEFDGYTDSSKPRQTTKRFSIPVCDLFFVLLIELKSLPEGEKFGG